MTLSRDELEARFPEARQLFAQFGQDYSDEFYGSERAAVDDYIWGRRLRVPEAIRDLDALLVEFPRDEDLRAAAFGLGLSCTVWDFDNSWRAFVQRLRDWLVESLDDPASGRPNYQDQANLVEVLRTITAAGADSPEALRYPALHRTGEYSEPPEPDPVPGALAEVERLLRSDRSDDYLRGLFEEFGFSYEDESYGAMRVLLSHLRDVLRQSSGPLAG